MTSRCNDASGIGGWFPGSCCLPEGHDGPHEDDDGVRWHSDVPLERIARRLHDARRADVKAILDRTYEDPQDFCRILTVPHLQGLRSPCTWCARPSAPNVTKGGDRSKMRARVGAAAPVPAELALAVDARGPMNGSSAPYRPRLEKCVSEALF